MSAVILEDFVKSFVKKPLTEKQTHYIMRTVVAIFGAICVCLVFLVEKLGSVLQLSMSLGAVSNGPLLGIFTMGVLLPWLNSLSAIIGGATGLGVMAWICVRAQAAIHTGELRFDVKPVETTGCGYIFIPHEPMSMLAINQTETVLVDPHILEEPEFAVYHISYLWYTLFGAMITITVATIVSAITGFNDPQKMNPNLFAPFVRRLLGLTPKREEPIGTEDDTRYVSCSDLKVTQTAV